MKKNLLLSALFIMILIMSCLTMLAQQVNTATTGQDNQRPAPITRPVIVEIARNTYFINEFGMNAMYLLMGEKSALVIDAGTIDVYSQRLKVLDDIVEAFRSLLRGDAKTEVVSNHLFPDRKSTVADYGSARVGFNPEKLWEEREEHIIP